MHFNIKMIALLALVSINSLSEAACREAVDHFDGRSTIRFETEGDVRRQNGYLVLRVVKGDRHPAGGFIGDGASATMTQPIQYGRITARLRTAGTRGIVSAMFTMANDKDEVDLEWLGGSPKKLLSNFFYKGDLIYTNSREHNINVDSSKQFVNYTLDWKPDQIRHMTVGLEHIDTPVVLPKSSSRCTHLVMLSSVWDGGDSDEDGTSEWAGGRVNWEDRRINDDGRLDMKIDFLEIGCYPGL
ncbi:concanavalin A-like lectin/glucanase [Basidiobolus meristosporus CBS 931.73]|uniref:Concanavalin A-like lectin/glucanase n=1 Tax=Basidiobolus meristosporus CBS 931.73 TaxID=1314790 RepID=A0A1Y1XSM6_9FUNG|nr:concanavalin A-like lectin/glucanase [Basidiobolus meristosporus CBS 931.73]|eukprot:ORX88740.1 concanavalin A-like lectin/glucanase [Basidiobolus meristosporus CBS 931.73]